MSGECSNCESRQRRGNDPRCLVCIYFNPAIFNKGFTNVKSQHFITKVEKAIKDAKVFRDKAKIADLRLKVKDVDEVLNSNNNSRTFQEIFDDKKEHWQKFGLDIANICGFEDAHKELDKKEINSFEEEVLFLTDYIIGRFEKQHSLMQFIAKNLSWGIFKNAFSSTEFPEAQGFYEHYLEALNKFNVKCEEPELLLFTIIELLGSTSYNCILYKQPVTMQEYLPHLHRILHQLLIAFTEET